MSLYEEFKRLSDDKIAKIIIDMVDNNQEEHQQLDFKGIESLNFLVKSAQDKQKKKVDFSHDLSAFANALGGVIIYGIEEQTNPATSKREMINFGNGFNEAHFKKDQLIQIANTCIEPHLPGIDVKSFKHPTNPDELIIIILIPETYSGAIMAVADKEDFRYYQRSGTEKLKLRDHQVRLINNKLVHPDLELIFDLDTGIYIQFETSSDGTLYIKAPTIYNKGKVIAEKVALLVRTPPTLLLDLRYSGFEAYYNNYHNTSYINQKYIINGIFPDMIYHIFDAEERIDFSLKYCDFLKDGKLHNKETIIEFILYCDNAPAKSYKVIIDTRNLDKNSIQKQYGLFLNNNGYSIRFPYTCKFSDLKGLIRFETDETS